MSRRAAVTRQREGAKDEGYDDGAPKNYGFAREEAFRVRGSTHGYIEGASCFAAERNARFPLPGFPHSKTLNPVPSDRLSVPSATQTWSALFPPS